MTDAVTYRAVGEGEQAQALALWQTVFTESPGFFERYFRPEFGFRDGDTLGAWSDGLLVSAVHLCRRTVTWDGRTFLCGGIANVATRPEFRRRGLSRRLLEMSVARMGRESFHFSLLDTGVPGHYAALGWEPMHAPHLTILLAGDAPDSGADWPRLTSIASLPPLYDANPRPLQFTRSAAYFEGWAGWNWRRFPTHLHQRPGRGYIILGIPADEAQPISATEWRAADAATERDLLREAASEVLRRGRRGLALEARPQFAAEDFLHSLGALTAGRDHGGMVRNIGLPESQYRRLVEAYRTGSAVWWPADGF